MQRARVTRFYSSVCAALVYSSELFSRLVPKGLLMARTLQVKDDSGVPSRPMPGQRSPLTFPSAGHAFQASETTLVTVINEFWYYKHSFLLGTSKNQLTR